MDLETIQLGITIFIAIGMFVLALQKQRADIPLTAAQIATTKTEGLRNEFDIMERSAAQMELLVQKQNSEIERLRGEGLRQRNDSDQKLAVMRAETEAKLTEQGNSYKKLQEQLTEANATIGTLTKRITDLEALLIVAHKETAEAKQESTDKTEAVKPPTPEVPIPLPIIIVPSEPPAEPRGEGGEKP